MRIIVIGFVFQNNSACLLGSLKPWTAVKSAVYK